MIKTALPSKGALLLTVVLPLLTGACTSGGLGDLTATISGPSNVLPATDVGKRQFTADWGRRFAANPGDKTSAMNYARGLRALTEYAQAVAVLQQAAVKHPNDLDILGAYGKALADDGRLREAADVLANAHTPERPNWSILSAQGVVADQMGDHATAQNYYRAALKIVPGEPAVLSNLGLSYALNKQLDLADATMRQAVASPRADSRVRQNFALVLALEGKFAEAETLEKYDLPAADAAANVSQIRQMIAQSDTWRDVQKPDDPAPHRTVAAASPTASAPGGQTRPGSSKQAEAGN